MYLYMIDATSHDDLVHDLIIEILSILFILIWITVILSRTPNKSRITTRMTISLWILTSYSQVLV